MVLSKKYKREFAKTLMPETFILADENNMQVFQEKYDKNKYYILKKNVQRKQGLKISNNYYLLLGLRIFLFRLTSVMVLCHNPLQKVKVDVLR